MKTFLSCTALFLGLGLSATVAHADAKLTRSAGVLGEAIQYQFQGDPGEIYIFLPSTQTGPTPLAVLDPNDPRMANVGIDLLNFVKFGPLNGAGQAQLNFALPGSPGLAGLTIHSQLFTAPGGATLIDEISTPNAVRLGFHGDSFLSVGNLAVPTAGYGSAALSDGRVVLGGGGVSDGFGGTVGTSAVSIFDGQTQGFAAAGNLTYAPINPAAVALSDGRVLFCGGIDGNNNVLNGASIYNPATGTSVAAASMGTPRVQHTATRLADGRVFVTGGANSLNAADPLASLTAIQKTSQIYNPANNTWSNAASLPNPRIGHNASLLPSGRVLITGGLEITTFIFPIPNIVKTARRYDPNSNSMVSTASFSGDRALHGQITLSDGRALIAGGADGDVLTQNFFSIANVATYNESSNAWTNQPSLPDVRTFPNLVEVGGEVHVLSGLATIDVLSLSGTPVTSILRASVANFAWSSVGNLVAARPLSTSHPVDGGDRIVVLGASGASDTKADVYIP
jgi:hypothetical protein